MDLLRLIFASLVVFAHCYDLSRKTELLWLRHFVSSELAVQGFFILSGFLITMSYERASTIYSYFSKRFRRLYPAYAAVIVGSAILLSVISSLSPSEYFGLRTLQYILANLAFLNFLKPDLPGVFQSNPYTAAVNGALWTIKIEVCFYLSIPIIVYFLDKIGRLRGLILLSVLSYGYLLIFDYLYQSTGRNIFDLLAKQLPGQMLYFAAGMFVYYYFNALKNRLLLCALGGAALYILSIATASELIRSIAIGLLVFSAAFAPRIANAARFGDFSYGIYIVHFPIIQLYIAIGMFESSPFGATALVYLSAFLLAVFSWHAIEKRFLAKSNHYVVESKALPRATG